MENKKVSNVDPSMNSSSVSHTLLPPEGVEIAVYHRRFYILAIFVGLAFMQSMTWNTWGPIADTALIVFGWNQSDIALLSNWGPIAYVLTAFLFSWLIEEKGLRISMVVAALLLLIGVLLRCIPVPTAYTLWVMHPGQLFIGLAGPVLMASPPALSAVWFPTHQRTTSTALGAMSALLGVAASFIVGPQIVKEVPNNGTNFTTISPELSEYEYVYEFEDDDIGVEYEEQLKQIRIFMYIEAGATAFFCVCAFIYFPAKPPKPPSTSASIPRENFFHGFKQLCRKKNFLVIALSYAIPLGCMYGWESELTLMLWPVGVQQDTVGWIGFYCNIGAVVGGLLFGFIVDLMGGRTMKMVLLGLTISAAASCVWILLLCMKYIEFHIVHCYISIIALGFLLNAMVPLFFEICAEGAYPIGEGTTTMFSTFLNNFFCLLFLLVALIKSLGTIWMTWAMLGSILIVLPLLVVYKEHYNRLDIDTRHEHENQHVIT